MADRAALTGIAWQVVSSDLFDRESPMMIDSRGIGLVDGLIELWRRVLTEGLHDSGRKTFTGFELRWNGGAADAGVQSDNAALARLRTWVYGAPGPYEGDGSRERTDILAREHPLLRSLADAHARLLPDSGRPLPGWSPQSAAERIKACARSSADATACEANLAALA